MYLYIPTSSGASSIKLKREQGNEPRGLKTPEKSNSTKINEKSNCSPDKMKH